MNTLTYTNVNGYMIPDLAVPDELAELVYC